MGKWGYGKRKGEVEIWKEEGGSGDMERGIGEVGMLNEVEGEGG